MENSGYDIEHLPDVLKIDMDKFQQEAGCLYHITCKELPVHAQVYAGAGFWKIDRLYAHNEEYKQKQRGKKRNYYSGGQTVKNVLKEISKADLQERKGMADWKLRQNVYWQSLMWRGGIVVKTICGNGNICSQKLQGVQVLPCS